MIETLYFIENFKMSHRSDCAQYSAILNSFIPKLCNIFAYLYVLQSIGTCAMFLCQLDGRKLNSLGQVGNLAIFLNSKFCRIFLYIPKEAMYKSPTFSLLFSKIHGRLYKTPCRALEIASELVSKLHLCLVSFNMKLCYRIGFAVSFEAKTTCYC